MIETNKSKKLRRVLGIGNIESAMIPRSQRQKIANDLDRIFTQRNSGTPFRVAAYLSKMIRSKGVQ